MKKKKEVKKIHLVTKIIFRKKPTRKCEIKVLLT